MALYAVCYIHPITKIRSSTTQMTLIEAKQMFKNFYPQATFPDKVGPLGVAKLENNGEYVGTLMRTHS